MDRLTIKKEPETENVKGKESYGCHVCKKNFSSQKKLEGHVKKAHPGTKPYRCLICDTSLTRMTSFKEHMNIHTGEKPHKCTVCHEAFATGKSLYRHQEKHEKPAERKCLNCQTKFETWSDFENHTKTCVRSVPSNARINDLVHSCNVCGLRFQRIGTLNEHMNTHTGNTPFSCRWCQERFPNTKQLRRHILNHDRKNPRCCARCQKPFSDWLEFQKHTNNQVCKTRTNVCTICNEKFTRQEDMESHYRMDHPGAEKLYGCDEFGCEKRFWQKQLLLIHKRLHARKKAEAVAAEQPKFPGFDCPVCKNRVENYKKLIEHVKTHLNEKIDEVETTIAEPTKTLLIPKYEMEETLDDYCNDYFDNGFRETNSPKVKTEPIETVKVVMADVKIEIDADSMLGEPTPKVKKKLQTNGKRKKTRRRRNDENRIEMESKQTKTSKKQNFECTFCGKVLMNEANFKVHCDSHIKQPQYECHHCGIRLNYHNSMRRHVRSHFEPKPFGCDVPDCQEKFRNISDARAHVKAHRIETGRSLIHTCTICGKSFSLKQVLNQHYKIHGDTTFHCDQCPAVFKIIARLRKHMLLHTGVKPFGCHNCGKHFNAKFNMQCHVMRCKNKMNGVIEQSMSDKNSQQQLKMVGFEPVSAEDVLISVPSTQTTTPSTVIERNFQCTICGKGLSSKSSLKVHLRTHTGQLPYGCDWPNCNLMFHSTAALEKHRREHTVN